METDNDPGIIVLFFQHGTTFDVFVRSLAKWTKKEGLSGIISPRDSIRFSNNVANGTEYW